LLENILLKIIYRKRSHHQHHHLFPSRYNQTIQHDNTWAGQTRL